MDELVVDLAKSVKFTIEPCENCGTPVSLWGGQWWMERDESEWRDDRWVWRDHTPELCRARRANAGASG